MSILTNLGRTKGLFVNHNGVRKEVLSGWANKGGDKVQFYGKPDSEGVFIMIPPSASGILKIAYSTDLNNWNEADIQNLFPEGANAYFYDAIYYKGNFLVLAAASSTAGRVLLKSATGKNWEAVNIDESVVISSVYSVLAVVDDYLCIAGTMGYLLYSDDLFSFSRVQIGKTGSASVVIRDIKKGKNRYYLVQSYGYSAYASTFPNFPQNSYMSGITTNNVNYGFCCLCYDEVGGVMYAGNATGLYYTTGTAWSSSKSSVIIYAMAKSKEYILAITKTGTVYRKEKSAGTTFGSAGSVGGNIAARNLCRGSGKFVTVASDRVVFSEDGTEWQETLQQPSFTGKIVYSGEGGTDDEG